MNDNHTTDLSYTRWTETDDHNRWQLIDPVDGEWVVLATVVRVTDSEARIEWPDGSTSEQPNVSAACVAVETKLGAGSQS